MNSNDPGLSIDATLPAKALADLHLIRSLAEGSEIRSGEDLIRIAATSGNSVLVLTAESFLSKYWRSLWTDGNALVDGIIHSLDEADATFNRQELYRLLVAIYNDTKVKSGDCCRSQSRINMLLVQVALEIAAANGCAPPDLVELPPYVAANLPQDSEYIACSLALECLCLIAGDVPESPWKSMNLPWPNRHTLEGIARELDKRHRHLSTPESLKYFEVIIKKIDSWLK